MAVQINMNFTVERVSKLVPTLFALATKVVQKNVEMFCHEDPNVTSIRDLRKSLYRKKEIRRET